MGVEKTKFKKDFLRARFPKSHVDFPNSRDCYKSLNAGLGHETPPPEKQFALVIDGSVHLENCMRISTPSVVVKDRKNDEDSSVRVAKQLFGQLQREILDSENVGTVVFTLGDTHDRPEMKEDRGHGNGGVVRPFAGFPIYERSMVEEHVEHIKSKYTSRMQASMSPKRSVKKKVGDESDVEEEDDEISAHNQNKLEKMNDAVAEFNKHTFDSWSDGKSLPYNRFFVYRALTKYIAGQVQELLKTSSYGPRLVIIDNAVLEDDKYVTLRITSDAIKAEGIPHHGICECEQLLVYWVHRLMITEKKSRFVLTTTDTDILGCMAINWDMLMGIAPEPISEKMIVLKVPNTDDEHKKVLKLPYGTVDLYLIFSKIVNVREWGFLMFIAFGCDFVAKEMHTLMMKSMSGKYGDDRWNKLLELILTRRREAPRPLTTVVERPDPKYRDGKELQLTLDIPALIALISKYRREDKNEKFDGFSDDLLRRLTYRFKTAVYAGEYYMNQWRIKQNAGQLFRDPASNKEKYGYVRGSDGKLVAMEMLKDTKKRAREEKKKKDPKKWSKATKKTSKPVKPVKPRAKKSAKTTTKKKK